MPVTVLVLLLSISFAPLPTGTFVMFFFGVLLLIFGMSLFNAGVDMAMTPFGEAMGSEMTKTKRIYLILAVCFLVGFIVTVAEPDLQVLAGQVSTIPSTVLLITISAGVGIFLVIAVLRILFHVPMKYVLTLFYVITFVLSFFVPRSFVPLAFDSGGVTTGPITVPFILALGIGISAIRGDSSSTEDTFGLVSVCSIGPILTVLLLGLLYKPDGADYGDFYSAAVSDSAEAVFEFASNLPIYIKEVAATLLPIILVFAVFTFLTRRFKNRSLIRVCAGFVYAFAGLSLFLTGVNVGFMPAGYYIGQKLAFVRPQFVIVLIAMVFGFVVVLAEPSVQVLNRRVEEITNGAVTKKTMQTALSIGVALSAGAAMLRVLTGISIYYFLVPGYIASIVLSFFVPGLFTGIAFDSGGVASGPMTASFMLPMAQGVCLSLGGNILTDAFGLVAMVAMTPILTIQIFGLWYKRQEQKLRAVAAIAQELDDDIIDYEQEGLSA